MAAAVVLARLMWLGSALLGGVPGGAAAAVKEPKPGRRSWIPVVALRSADPAGWKVSPDGAAAKPGIESAFQVAPEAAETVYFAPASVGHAAVVAAGREDIEDYLECLRYELTQTEPVGRVRLLASGTPENRVLGPHEPGGGATIVRKPVGRPDRRGWLLPRFHRRVGRDGSPGRGGRAD